LRSSLTGQAVLSVYLDTTPERVAGRAFVLELRDACKELRPAITQAESAAFESSVLRIEHYLNEEFEAHQRGLALFATQDGTLIAVSLAQAPLEDVVWAQHPEISPLEQIVDDAERIAVVLFDAQRARLLTVFLGALESETSLTDDVPRKQATGGWFGLQQTKFARHREDHVRRHAERTVRALMDLLRTRSFDRLLLAGPDEPLAVLRRELPRPLRVRVAGTLDAEVFASASDVLAATLRRAEELERQHEQQLVAELFEAASTPAVMLGPAGTLGALAEGRVHMLIMAADFEQAGATCPACSRLVLDAHRCPGCGFETTPVSSLREAVIRQARQQGARLELVSGPAAERLAEVDGIAAWTRF
jgi:peptide subunit release factor 1 (eRF1)